MSAFASDLSILIVEDQAVQRTLLAGLLQSLGVSSVHESSEGAQALERIRGAHVDIVITDLDMPGMDGLEFLRRLSELDKPRISVILVSAVGGKLLASAGAMAKAYGLPLLGTAEKPLTSGKLFPLISRHQRGTKKPARSGATAGPVFDLAEIAAGLREDQFEPYFQPQLRAQTGRVVGAEALARWVHPRHGVVLPQSFVPALEQAHRLDELTFAMLRKAALACREWHRRGWPLRVSVNLSLVSLSQASLADTITCIVRSQGIEPSSVVLEITETAAMTEVAPALENLARLRMRGFGLSIDDYGTGFSTLRQLTRVPFTELKIDRGFVAASVENRLARAVVESSIDMARRLGIEAVAEGVEAADQLSLLRELGCDVVQGYLLGRPVPADAFIGGEAGGYPERVLLSA